MYLQIYSDREYIYYVNLHIIYISYIYIYVINLLENTWHGNAVYQVDYDLPVVVHARDADDDTLEVMRLGTEGVFPVKTAKSLVFL